MVKRFLLTIFFILLLGGSAIGYGLFRAREGMHQQRQTAKAEQTTITLLEGWSNRDIADYLEKKGVTTSASFLAAAKSFDSSGYQLLSENPKNSGLEGFIFPDTYFIPANPPAGTDINQIIIKKALDNFTQKISPQMMAQASADKMSLYQIITLASIVEKESGANQNDKNLVAGIFYNRLRTDMPLQSDATVNYVTGKSATQPSIQDTQVDSPYNTYKNKGLPPGPICNPSLSSIMAALYPTSSGYFYFLTDPQTGRLVPAKTLDEHNQNKAKYLN